MKVVPNDYCNDCRRNTDLIVTGEEEDSIFATCPHCGAKFDLINDGTRVKEVVEDTVTLCEVCNVREHTQLCDYAKGTGIVTSIDYQELTETCDKKLCRKCAVNIWANCDVCPEHAEQIKAKLSKA